MSKTFTIAVYNIMQMTKLFRDKRVKEEYRERALAIADVIRRLDADVLGVIEAPTVGEVQAFVSDHLTEEKYQVAAGATRGYENLLFLYRDPDCAGHDETR